MEKQLAVFDLISKIPFEIWNGGGSEAGFIMSVNKNGIDISINYDIFTKGENIISSSESFSIHIDGKRMLIDVANENCQTFIKKAIQYYTERNQKEFDIWADDMIKKLSE